MARYQCGICGFIFDEDALKKEFQIWRNVRSAGPAWINSVWWRKRRTEPFPEPARPSSSAPEAKRIGILSCPTEYGRMDGSVATMDQIHEMAVTGQPIIKRWGRG